jgi:DNA polymerase-3 subunit beta
MGNLKITIDHAIVKALLTVAPKKDIRYYLQGICVDATKDTIVLVATDGHMLMAFPVSADNVENRVEGQWIIDRVDFDAIKPAKAGKHTLPLTIELDEKGYTISGATKAINTFVDGRFPDWRRVVPQTLSGELAQFNLEILSRVDDIRKALGRDKYDATIHHNGNACAQITGLHPNALLLVMPCRSNDSQGDAPIPSWARM